MMTESMQSIAKQHHGPVSNERVLFDSKTLTIRERERM